MTLIDLSRLLKGALVSLELAAFSIPGATILAILLVLLGVSSITPLRWLYRALLWVVRGTPLVLLALAALYIWNAEKVKLPIFIAGGLVLSVYFAMLVAEVIRGALDSIPASSYDSAKSLGLPRTTVLRKIIVPLVVRQGLPSYVNVCVMAIKSSSVLSIIGVFELTYASKEVFERNLAVFQVLTAAAVIYFVICYSFGLLGKVLERRLQNRGFAAGH